jgi:hypothetical protein
MFSVGSTVHVTGVFAETFSLTYTVVEIVMSADGTVAYLLDHAAGGFDAMYLEAA